MVCPIHRYQRRVPVWCVVVLASLGLLGWGSVAWPNAGPRSTGAFVIAEPPGVADVQIARETLSIDLRPAQLGQKAIVEATYLLHNEGEERLLELLFAFGSRENKDWSITLDDKPLEGVITPGADMPIAWRPPRETPGLESDTPLSYGLGWPTVAPLAFKLVVPSGNAVLKVRYQAEIALNYARPSMYRQFAYILSPARSWASFGGLDLTIQVPGGWSVAATLDLEREGDLLRGNFDRIPADSLAITMRPAVPVGYQRLFEVSRAVAIFLGLAGWFGCWKAGRVWAGELVRSAAADASARYYQTIKLLGGAVLIGFLYGMLMTAATWWTAFGPDVVYPPSASEQQLAQAASLSFGYLSIFKMIGLFLLAGVLAGVAGLIALVAGLLRRRSLTNTDLAK
ncbi:MAG: hypothetical protein CMJ70_04110 [Planctomycetaceae bacterium]|nr:hypothetical protein [Planctomycetaceae bacterium]